MIHPTRFLFGFLLAAGVFLASVPARGEIHIVTTTEDIYAITREITRDRANVETLTHGFQDLHYVEAKPSYMVRLNRADLLIYQGLELEIGWLPLLLEGARNPKIMPGQLGHLDLSRGVLPREVPEGPVDRAQGDIHPLGNPHYPLDPKNGVLMAIAIMERLEIMDSENLNAYRKNLQDFLLRLQKKIPEWHSRMKPFQGEPVVTYHQTWAYFLKEFNIKRAGTIERNPGIPPSPKHLTFLAQTMNREKVKVILQANYFESEFSDLLAEKTGARVLKLPVSVGGVPGVENYIDLFDHLVSKLEEAFAQD